MPFFPCAHAGHPLWQHAVKQVAVQLRAQISMQKLNGQPCLGVVYVSAAYADHATDIMSMLATALPEVQHWVGSAGHSVLAGDMDYGRTGAVAAMLPYIDRCDYEVFSGAGPWQGHLTPHTLLVHGDASSSRMAMHVQEVCQSMQAAVAVGGLCDLQQQHAQWSWGAKASGSIPASIGGGGVQVGGLSGLALTQQVACMAIGMHGCKPIGSHCTVTAVDRDVILSLDGQPALAVLFPQVDWGAVLTQHDPHNDAVWNQLQHTLLAWMPSDAAVMNNALPPQARVVRVVGVDPLRQGVVVDGLPQVATTLVRCQPDAQAARAEIRRACAQLWEALTAAHVHTDAGASSGQPEGRSICGAVYIRNRQRHEMARSMQVDSELQLIRHALGPVPLLGFTSSLEIEGGKLQYLSAQLLIFTQPLAPFT